MKILNTPPAQLVFDSVRDAIAACVNDVSDMRVVHKHVAQRKDLAPAIEQGISKGLEDMLAPGSYSARRAVSNYDELHQWVSTEQPSLLSGFKLEHKAKYVGRLLECAYTDTAVNVIEKEAGDYRFFNHLQQPLQEGLMAGLVDSDNTPDEFDPLVEYQARTGRNELLDPIRQGFAGAVAEQAANHSWNWCVTCVDYLADKPKILAAVSPAHIEATTEGLLNWGDSDTHKVGILKGSLGAVAPLAQAFSACLKRKNAVAYSAADTGIGEAMAVWLDGGDSVWVASTKVTRGIDDPSSAIDKFIAHDDYHVRGQGVAIIFDGLARLADPKISACSQDIVPVLEECRDNFFKYGNSRQVRETYRNMVALSTKYRP